MVATGSSRGGEAALLLGAHYPELIHGAVVYAPSARVNGGFPAGGDAWTKDGAPIARGDIALGGVSGPVLAVAGADDRTWPSATWARQIDRQLAAANTGHPHRALTYPGAGHGVGTFPYLPAGTRSVNPTDGRLHEGGGSRPADEAAKAAGWPEVPGLPAGLES